MNLVRAVVGGLSPARIEQRDTLSNPSDVLRGALVTSPTFTGRSVTPESALGLNAVYAAVRLISGQIGSTPLIVYRDTEGGRERARDSHLWQLVHDEPNAEISAGELWAIVTTHLLLHGNAYLWKKRDENGLVAELWPILPSRVSVGRDENDQKVYGIRQANGQSVGATDRDILHIRDFGTDGLVGLSPIEKQRQILGVLDAQTEYVGRFYANNAQPGGIISIPKTLDDEGVKRLKASWDAAHRGLANAAKVAVLEEGAEWQSLSMNLQDQQFIEHKRFGVQEVARMYNLPPYMLGESSGDSVTYSNSEQQLLMMELITLRPIARNIEQAVHRDGDLMIDPSLLPEFLFDADLRVDARTRADVHKIGVDGGWISRNEVRAMENRKPVDGLDGFGPLPAQQDSAASRAG